MFGLITSGMMGNRCLLEPVRVWSMVRLTDCGSRYSCGEGVSYIIPMARAKEGGPLAVDHEVAESAVSGVSRLRRVLVESPGSLGARARAKRWALVQTLFPDIRDMRVLDLGGTVEAWQRAPIKPAHVTVVNLFEPGETNEPWLLPVMGDACAASEVLAAGSHGDSFDLVFSNSLIEHVGGHAKRVALAVEVRALAPYHWVQTPYRYFPVEPHWLFPMMQFLPVRARASIARSWPLAHSRPATMAEAQSNVQWTELVSITEMRAYFPNSQVVHERVAGLVKSITAVHSPG